MFVEKMDCFTMLHTLRNYSESFPKNVDIQVYKTIKSIHDKLLYKVETEGIHIVCSFDEIEDLVYDYVSMLANDKNLFVFAKVGLGVPVEYVAWIKNVGDFTYGKVELLPFNQNIADVELFITGYSDETLNIDYTTKLLVYEQ